VKRKSSEKGQISIMVGVMMSTFILFFAFVINTGMLVNAKINLQNAADLAAYAGAAVQARQMTQISYLNYEMRRQWKKLLFRLYVVGNMSQDGFPRTPGGSGAMVYKPNNGSAVNYGIPSTCIIFNSRDNYCHITDLEKIEIPPQTFLDSVTDTLRGQLQSLEEIRQNTCKATGLTNKMLNVYWLFNADPMLTSLSSAGNTALAQDQFNASRIIQGLTYGLGIVPRELILRFRIKTLNAYVNSPNQKSINREMVENLSKSADPASFERTIQAFYSAYYTLGNHSFPGASIMLDEMLPGDTSSANLLQLKDIKQRVDTFVIDFSIGGNIGGAASRVGNDCKAMMIPISLAKPLVVGVYKDPTVMTYYAVRVKAKARILFSPFGDIEMKAYAAAQPFGSRIGPSQEQVQFGMDQDAANRDRMADPSLTKPAIPNLAVKEGDAAAPGRGWDTLEVLGTMYQNLAVNGRIPDSISAADMQRAYAPAMAPNPWEANRYNIISDIGADSFVRNFSPEQGTFGPIQQAAFWAPIFAPNKLAQSSQEIKNEVDALFNNNIAGNNGNSTNPIENLKTTLQMGLEQYLKSLQTGAGEDGEGVNIVRLSSPFVQTNGAAPQASNREIFLPPDPKQFKTSWNTVNDGNYRNEGRVGYSVKFVAFDSLTRKKLTTNGGSTWNNNPQPPDAEAEADIMMLKH
jgi:hypothetical protein